MRYSGKIGYLLGLAVLGALATTTPAAQAQTISPSVAKPAAPVNSVPNPYRSIENWAHMPEGRAWGATAGVYVDPAGTSVWTSSAAAPIPASARSCRRSCGST